MKRLGELYDYILLKAAHAKASYYLFILSVTESSFFPIPPDVMLAPMCLAKPARAWNFALITTIGSVLGGVIGYLIGKFLFDSIDPLITQMDYMMAYQKAVHWFNEWGFWAILIAGFTPIPYKVFTIAAGVLNMAFIPFVIGSTIGRGGTFLFGGVSSPTIWQTNRLCSQKIHGPNWLGRSNYCSSCHTFLTAKIIFNFQANFLTSKRSFHGYQAVALGYLRWAGRLLYQPRRTYSLQFLLPLHDL